MIIIKTIFAFFSDLLNVLFVVMPVLLIAGAFHWKSFRKSKELQFFLLAVALLLGWRFVFCFYNGGGISSRYIAVLPLLFIFFAVPGIPVLACWIKRLAAWRKIRLSRGLIITFLLLIVVGVNLSKALNPPDRKPYIQEAAIHLQNAPANALLIDSTADGGRVLFTGGLERIELKTVAKYYKTKEGFWHEFKPLFDEYRKTGRPIYLLLRMNERNDDAFIAECRKEFEDCPLVKVNATKIKKALVVLYKSR